jgi:FkbM family methyltransferase
MQEMLSEGMVAVDVGAHVGVYSLLAARLVGSSGVVHAIEPQRDCVTFLRKNVAANNIDNVEVHQFALGHEDATVGLAINHEVMGAAVASPETPGTETVAQVTLETLASMNDIRVINLLKIDAAGNELAVLAGGETLLREGRISTVICKLYHPDVVAERFPGQGGPGETLTLFGDLKYEVFGPSGAAVRRADLSELLPSRTYSIPVVATRRDPNS